ncbi:MAG: hypothetical protein ACXWG1_06030 [Usitatibacter sp.]
MKRIWIAAALACASLAAGAASVEGVMKPGARIDVALGGLRLDASAAVASRLALPGYAASSRKSTEALAPNQIGVSRKADVDAQPRIDESGLRWQAAGVGYAAHLRIVSPDAAGLRVGLRFTALPRELEVRVAEIAPDGTARVVALTTGADMLKLARGVFPIDHWTASTEGAEQLIELWSPARPAAGTLRFTVDDVSHLLQRVIDPVRSKVLDFNCHVDVSCIADAAVQQDSLAVARMAFTDGGKSFVCSGSLLTDVPHSFTPIFASANHCISRQEVASTLETWWFYQTSACNAGIPQSPVRLNHGATLLMANFDVDFALMQLNDSVPNGSFFLGWDALPLVAGQSIFGIHHPDGSYKRYSAGKYLGLGRVTNSATQVTFAELFKEVQFTQGIIEGGSSGSPLLTAPGTFQGTLFGSPSTNSCTGDVFASYSDFTKVYPLVKTFLQGPAAGDDYGDTPNGAAAIDINAKLVAQMNIDGDSDWFRFTFTQAGTWTVSSFDVAPGQGIDMRGEVYAADGSTRLAVNDDVSATNTNFSITRSVTPGTYYVRASAAPGVTGPYGLSSSFVPPDDFGDSPATAANLPVNGSITGQLAVLNDQDWFKLTFTQAGTFHVESTGTTDTMGTLYQADGTTVVADNDDIDPGVLTNFTLTVPVTGPGVMYLRVRGFDGQTGNYGLQTTFGTGSASGNFTDLWWAGASESGWGVNLNHQSDVIFATLFTYAADRNGMWLVASMTKQADGSFTGPLLQTTGPAFNASPWIATSVSSTQVGTMTLTFADLGHGTLVYTVNGTRVTKSIVRQVFGTPVTCTFTSASRASATNYQDLWFNSAESGWGINFTHQGTLMFATLFTYAANNRGMWLVASMTKQADGSYSGDLLRTTGPSFDTSPWTVISWSTVGTMRAAFSDGVTGTLTYSVDGVPIAKPIQRQVFGTTQSICR